MAVSGLCSKAKLFENCQVNRRFLLVSTLVLNLALGAVCLGFLRQPVGPATTSPDATPIASPSSALGQSALALPIPKQPVVASPLFSWRMIESEDYRQYIANLRAVGCPEQTIRDIIVANIERLYRQKVFINQAYRPPWHTARGLGAETNLMVTDSSSALEEQKRALVRKLFGYEWDIQAGEIWQQNTMASLVLGFLPENKATELIVLADQYRAAAQRIRDQAHSILIEEDRNQLRKLHGELLAEAAQRLNPSDFDELQLRLQALGFLPQANLSFDDVSITSMQLREITRFSRDLQDVVMEEFLGHPRIADQEQLSRMETFEKQVEQLLGPELFARFQRSQNQNFREVFAFTREHHLPEVSAVAVYEARRLAEEQSNEVKSNSSLSSEDKVATLVMIRTNVAAAVSSALGSQSRDYLSESGPWLESLAAPPENPLANQIP